MTLDELRYQAAVDAVRELPLTASTNARVHIAISTYLSASSPPVGSDEAATIRAVLDHGDDDLTELAKERASPPPVGGSGEVVAWRWRAKAKGVWGLWSVVDVDPNDWTWRDYWEDLDIIPLYVASVPNGVPEGWSFDLTSVPRDRDFLIQYDHGEVTVGHYLDNSKTRWPYEGVRPCRSMRAERVKERIVAWRDFPAVSPVTPEGLSGG